MLLSKYWSNSCHSGKPQTDSPNCSLTVSLPVKHLSQPPPSVGAQIDDQLFPSGFHLNCKITLSKFIRRFHTQDNIKKFRFNEQSFKWQQEMTAGKYCSSEQAVSGLKSESLHSWNRSSRTHNTSVQSLRFILLRSANKLKWFPPPLLGFERYHSMFKSISF